MRSKDVLKQALLDFEGAVLVVSHDREFLTGLVTKVVEFKHGVLREYVGDMSEFLATKEREEQAVLTLIQQELTRPNEIGQETRTDSQAQREATKQRQREERRIKRRIEEVETLIAQHEEDIAQYEQAMSSADFYSRSDMHDITARYQRTKEQLDTVMEEWSTLNEELESLQVVP